MKDAKLAVALAKMAFLSFCMSKMFLTIRGILADLNANTERIDRRRSSENREKIAEASHGYSRLTAYPTA